MNVPAKASRAAKPPSRILVAAEGGLGLRPVAGYAMQLSDEASLLKLVAVTGNPRVLFPWIILSRVEWTDAHMAVLASNRMAINTAAQQIRWPTRLVDSKVLDLSEEHETAAVAVGSLARKWCATLIAITAFARDSRGHGSWRLDPEELVAEASCPVLHLPFSCLEDSEQNLSKILVGVDGSEGAMDALRTAIAQAPPNAHFHVAYVVDHTHGLRATAQIKVSMNEGVNVLVRAKALLRQHGCDGETSLIGTSEQGHSVPEALLHEADRWGAHLLVIGSRGRGAVTRWLLGSIAERVLRDSTRPVLVCPPARHAASEASMSETRETEMKGAVGGAHSRQSFYD